MASLNPSLHIRGLNQTLFYPDVFVCVCYARDAFIARLHESRLGGWIICRFCSHFRNALTGAFFFSSTASGGGVCACGHSRRRVRFHFIPGFLCATSVDMPPLLATDTVLCFDATATATKPYMLGSYIAVDVITVARLCCLNSTLRHIRF